jgi:DNA-binding transcriptional ArsR family regulator
MVATRGETGTAVEVDDALDRAVAALKFLSDRNRLRILAALTRSEACVCDLIEGLGLPQPLVSYHLGKLRKAGLVRSRREAQWVYYSLDPEAWAGLTAPLAGLLDPAPLPPEATYGANARCRLVPPDPDRGACDDDRC